MSPKILNIESATDCCSVSLSEGEKLLDEIFEPQPKSQASLLAPMVENLLKRNNLSISDIDAVAISEGPGSYTGLRVGLSLAKGICYGASLPLIGVNTLAAMAQCAKDKLDSSNGGGIAPDAVFIPMIDARRMEVYSAVFSSNGSEIEGTRAVILDENSFAEYIASGKVVFTGNGSAKFAELLKSSGTAQMPLFVDEPIKSSGMRVTAAKAFANADFKDTAYFEPFYLKDFVAGTPKKLL